MRSIDAPALVVAKRKSCSFAKISVVLLLFAVADAVVRLAHVLSFLCHVDLIFVLLQS